MMTRGNSKDRQAANKSERLFDFASEFRAFLQDKANAELLRETFQGPVLKEIKQLQTIITEKDEVIEHLQQRLSTLEQHNDELEQYSRRNSVRVTGIREDEDKECYMHVIDTLNENLPCLPEPITISEIDRLHRSGKPRQDGTPRPVLIKFTSYQYRQKLMQKRSALKGTNIFINEDLTKQRNQFLWSARILKRNGKIRDCWSSDGRILAKDLNGKTHLLKNTDDLNQLSQKSAIPTTTVAPIE
jgi:exosome complex exonuclease DIS3/RRP44